MARFLLAWELGGSLGHLVNLKPIAEGLLVRGHSVWIVARDRSRVKVTFPEAAVEFIAGPGRDNNVPHISLPHTFADLLFNVGFGSLDELERMTEEWRSIYRWLDPDVIVFDHSPVALLAARGLRSRLTTIGTGFFCPLDYSPMPDLRGWDPGDPAVLSQREQFVLKHINRRLQDWNLPALHRVTQLYHPLEEHFLATFPELDHYDGRQNARYYGVWHGGIGQAVHWPAGSGKRIYAYLKPIEAISALLGALKRLGQPTLVYCDGIPRDVQEQWRCPHLDFTDEPLNIDQIGAECDLAILNGNSGTTSNLLLAGRPTLQIPIYVEQVLFARKVFKLGAGLAAPANFGDEISSALETMLSSSAFATASKRFSKYYADYESEYHIEKILDRCEALASQHMSEAAI